MELQTISQISKSFNLSTRTLRYYEQIGLIKSEKAEDYAYRVYTEDTVRRLEQILVLRKLRIPLRQIAFILQCENAAEIIDTFRQNLSEVDDEITVLSTIRDIIAGFISRLNDNIAKNGAEIKLNLMDDTALLEAVDALTVQKTPQKEEKTVADLQVASEKLNKLTDRDVRIVYLPPMTVASIHIANGEGSERISSEILDKFIADVNLKLLYPAARNFGFNNPDGVPDNDPTHGYERWISIPDNMEVPEPFVKKHLDGGIYAAHVIPMGAWDEGWVPLHEWVSNSKNFDFRWNTVEGVCGWLEEHLNYWDWNINDEDKVNQFDLLMPIKPRFAAGTKHPQERIVDTFNYNSVPVEVLEWDETIWCGKIGYAENNTDEPNANYLFKKLSDHGFVFEGLKNNNPTDKNIIISYPDDTLMLNLWKLIATKTKNINRLIDFLHCSFRLIQDDLHTKGYSDFENFIDTFPLETEKSFVYKMDETLLSLRMVRGEFGYYYSSEKALKQKTPCLFRLINLNIYNPWHSEIKPEKLELGLRIRNVYKCMEYLKTCPDSVKRIFTDKNDSGCQKHRDNTCKHGVSYEIDGQAYWRCACCDPAFCFQQPKVEDISHYIKLVELGEKK